MIMEKYEQFFIFYKKVLTKIKNTYKIETTKANSNSQNKNSNKE